MPTTAVSATPRRVPVDRLRSTPALVHDYCTNYDTLADYYAGDWRQVEARHAAAQRAATHPRDRDTVVEVLLEQNDRWGLDATTHAHIEALRDPTSVAVVTGQQMGLMTGPLYTPYKTITALQLAKRFAEETDRPVVPVFWIEGEDHDFEEVASTRLLRRNEVVPVRYTGHALPDDGNLGPVGRLVLTEQVNDVIAQIDEVLPPSDFKGALMERVRAAYRPGTTWQDAFARFMRALFPDAGLVFIDPDDPRLKRLVAPLYRREIEEPDASTSRVLKASERLKETYHVQVHPRPTNLFLLDDEGRHAIDVDGDRFVLRGQNRSYTEGELLELLHEHPERFSPNVVLRPLTQDTLLPTAAYVAGPGEISYFAQYKNVYAWAGLPMPIIYPRASVTLVESKVQKVLDKFSLSVADFDDDLERLFQRIVLAEMDRDIETMFKNGSRHLHQAINELKPQIEDVDRTLVKSAEATRATLVNALSELKDRVVRAEKRQHDEIRAQLEKAHVNLFPEGTPQERVVSVLYFLNKYGLDLMRHLEQRFSLDTSEHQVLEL